MRHEPRDAGHRGQDALHFFSSQHERAARHTGWTDQPVDPWWVHEQNVAIQEGDSGESLDVGRRAYAASADQRIEKNAHLFRSELTRVASVERDESADPRGVCLGGSGAEMTHRERSRQEVAKGNLWSETRRLPIHNAPSTTELGGWGLSE